MPPMLIRSFATVDELAAAAAAVLTDHLRIGLERRGEALFVATGGSMAAPIYSRLAQTALTWEKVRITLSDERQVDEAHPASNAALIRTHLLSGAAAAAAFTPLTDADALARLPWPADACLLGMGADLHVASIFPAGVGMAQALEARARVVVTTPDPLPANAPFARLTLSLPTLAASRLICVAFHGEDKRRALDSAPDDAPISMLAQRAGDRLQIVCSG